MAVTLNQNRLKITADNDTYTGNFNVEAIVYFPGTGSPDFQIKQDNTSGEILWSAHLSTARLCEQLPIKLSGVTHFDLAGSGTIVYLYGCIGE
jgi:hypothetical protein